MDSNLLQNGKGMPFIQFVSWLGFQIWKQCHVTWKYINTNTTRANMIPITQTGHREKKKSCLFIPRQTLRREKKLTPRGVLRKPPTYAFGG